MATRRADLIAQQDVELAEWLESMESLLRLEGPDRAKLIFRALRDFLSDENVIVEDATLNTPYRNTIPLAQQPAYPGPIELEQRIENILRWNAMAMVLQAYDSGTGVGGHIGTYASAATIMEVGLNHFFRNKGPNYGGDLVSMQAHAAPGIYARAFLEGRLSEAQLQNFRRELQPEGGLSSYPHPRNMPDFWQMPCASMGLSTPSAIYQARFAKYLESRNLKPKNGGKIWGIIGDGESDEPEVLGTINIAARERLDNLIMVVNCNLQRLDGPVRGNGKIIQELERSFRGAGWQVIKVIWSGEWDSLFAIDDEGVLQNRMEQAVDGDYQMYSVSSGPEVRSHWVGDNEKLADIMSSLSDEEIRGIKRGGHDHRKIYAAFERAADSDRPTVILIKTIKGFGMQGYEGSNAVHQKKNLSAEERVDTAKRLGIPLHDAAAQRAEFYRPPEDSEELKYLRERREALGGFWPQREVNCPSLPTPDLDFFKDQLTGSGDRELSTTMAFVRMLAKLMDHPDLGEYIVPIVPDEARTFGMEALFRKAGIYSSEGQKYRPVDSSTLMPYREAEDGQIFQEGICEAGAMASFMAAGTAYAVHGVPTIPFYVFYSIFGFQRVGDMIWSCGDMLSRGFLLGGTSGRTTLNGEGLQHEDGHSQVIANTVPNLLSYDPAFAYELAVIVQEGIRRMYTEQENIFYYITIHNQNYSMPAMPERAEAGIVRGMYRYLASDKTPSKGRRAQLFGSGAIMDEVLRAQELLEARDIATDVWSVTSYNELSREALRMERENRLGGAVSKPKTPYIRKLLANEQGVFVAASDYMKSLALSIARWIPGPYVVLGTDGYGLSESRPDLRNWFEVSAEYIAFAAVAALAEHGAVSTDELEQAAKDWNIDRKKPDPACSGPADTK